MEIVEIRENSSSIFIKIKLEVRRALWRIKGQVRAMLEVTN